MNLIELFFLVIVFIVGLIVEFSRQQEQERLDAERQRKRAEETIVRDLTQSGVANLVAFGDSGGARGTEEQEPADLQALLVAREAAKWHALNAGRLLATALVGSGSVTTRFSADGAAHLDIIPGSALPVDIGLTVNSGSYVPKEFQMTRTSPDTAIIQYKVEKGWTVASATTVWARRDGRWVTVSYQVTKV